MPWSDEVFRKRVAERAQELGKTVRRALTDAGLALETLDRIPVSGRRIDTLEKLAGALDWSLAEIMGHAVQPRVSGELLDMAEATVQRALRGYPDMPRERFFGLLAGIYNLLADRQRDGLVIDQTFLDGVAAGLAETWQNKR